MFDSGRLERRGAPEEPSISLQKLDRRGHANRHLYRWLARRPLIRRLLRKPLVLCDDLITSAVSSQSQD
jgi:hypothetical protein